MIKMLKAFWAEEEGAAAIEYALIAGLIAVAIVAGATLMGEGMGTMFTALGTKLGALADLVK